VTRPNALGEYLRARRELVDPADVGLSVAGVRRTPGLRLRSIFLDEDEQDLHPGWERFMGGMVAAFRTSLGTDVDDPRLAQLVGSCRWRASCSGSCGRGTTSSREQVGRRGCAIRRSGCSNCAARSSRSAIRAGSSW
jgi:hypothetical protein